MEYKDFLLWEASTRDTIDFKKVYVDVAGGDLIAGLIISEIVYWYLPDQTGTRNKLRVEHGGYQWIAIERKDWWDRIRITVRQADRAIKYLEASGLIEKRIYRFNGQPLAHLRLIENVFLDKLNCMIANPPLNPYGIQDYTKCNSGITESVIPELPKVLSQDDEKGNPLTKITTETTTETTSYEDGPESELSEDENRVDQEEAHQRTVYDPKEYDSSEIESEEPVYVDDDEFAVRKRPKWMLSTSELCTSAFKACGRQYFQKQSERSAWLKIEKGITPLTLSRNAKYPKEWVDHCIGWFKKQNRRVVKLPFERLIMYIENDDKRTDWVAGYLSKKKLGPSQTYDEVDLDELAKSKFA